MQLPENYVDTEIYRTLFGSQIEEMNPGLDVSPDAKYRVKVSDFRKVNHFKRLLRIHKSKGWDGVVAYVKGVTEMEIEAMKPVSIGGIQTQYD